MGISCLKLFGFLAPTQKSKLIPLEIFNFRRMILRTNHSGVVLFFIACLTCIAHTEVIDDDGLDMPQRFKRDYQDDPKDYLDKVIEHWIYKIPVLIDIAVAESEKDLRLTVAKRVTQVNFAQILSFLSSQK